MKTIYLECNMGASGDMLMGALYEICEEKELFLQIMTDALSPFDVQISAVKAKKCGILGTHMVVTVHGTEEGALGKDDADPKDDKEHGHDAHHAASYSSILRQIRELAVPDEVKNDAVAIYQLIGDAEAKVHGTTLDQIHFHEVGTLDALADVVGCSLLIHLISPGQILASPIHIGNGFTRCAHGVLPVPAPATAELLKGIPSYTGAITGELCTPTGAAILRHFVTRFFSMPPIATESIGYGMGQKDFEIVNCVRAFWGETASQIPQESEEEYAGDDCVLSISCNIDDMTGEAIGLATEIMIAAGALDIYTTPIQMKKNRPGILLTCLCELPDREKFTGLFFLHTSTRGLRYQIFERAKLESTFETRSTTYGNIRFKKSAGYGIKKEKPEFEDLKSVVLKNGCSLSLDEVTKALLKKGC